MPTRTEIIEAGAEAVCLALGHRDGGSECEVDHTVAEAALAAMLPLIKAQMVAEVRGVGSTQTISPLADTGAVALGLAEVRGLERGLNHAALIIEEYEL